MNHEKLEIHEILNPFVYFEFFVVLSFLACF